MSIFTRGEPKAKSNYQLTPLGKTKAEEFKITGMTGKVMGTLEDSGPCTLREVANELHISPERAKRVVNYLVSEGWARRISSEV